MMYPPKMSYLSLQSLDWSSSHGFSFITIAFFLVFLHHDCFVGLLIMVLNIHHHCFLIYSFYYWSPCPYLGHGSQCSSSSPFFWLWPPCHLLVVIFNIHHYCFLLYSSQSWLLCWFLSHGFWHSSSSPCLLFLVLISLLVFWLWFLMFIIVTFSILLGCDRLVGFMVMIFDAHCHGLFGCDHLVRLLAMVLSGNYCHFLLCFS